MIMKGKSIIVVISLVLGLAACKKGSNYPIVGKWQQIKLRTYAQTFSGVIFNDTSILRSSFNSGNYAQFNNDGTCVIGLPYPPGYFNTENYNYVRAGSKYVLTIPPSPTAVIDPGGFITTDTASINATTLLIHKVFNNHQDYIVSDSYYTK